MSQAPVRDQKNVIISLFDYSLSWAGPYRKAGYPVVQVDLKHGIDILTWNYKRIPQDSVLGILAAPPCTDFAVSGAQYWPIKDADGRTAASVALVLKTLEIIDWFKPKFWSLENPVGRLSDLIPQLGIPWYWQPYAFGDPWTKKTGLWGSFNQPQKDYCMPIRWADQGSWSQLLGGKGERTKAIRSITPVGFAAAFFDANNPLGLDRGQTINMMGRCKYGHWTCDFAVCREMCEMCDSADNYEENEYAMQFNTEEDFMLAVFNKGQGILDSVTPEFIYQ